MAIIRSLAIGKGRKSAGNLTFRTVRGRTIVSEKVGQRATRGSVSKRAFIFGLITRFIAMRAADVASSFEPTKYGTPRNAFMKLNYSSMYAALEGLYVEGKSVWDITDAAISEAVAAYASANPESIYRVKMGSTIEYLDGEWPANVISEPRLALPFLIGGTAVVGASRLDPASFALGSAVKIPVINGALVTGVSAATVRYLVDDGSDIDVSVPLSDVSLSEENGSYFVTGKLSASIPVGEYELQVSVTSPEIKNTVVVSNVWIEESPIQAVRFNGTAVTAGETVNFSGANNSLAVDGVGFEKEAPKVSVNGGEAVAMNVTNDTLAQLPIELTLSQNIGIEITVGDASFSFVVSYYNAGDNPL